MKSNKYYLKSILILLVLFILIFKVDAQNSTYKKYSQLKLDYKLNSDDTIYNQNEELLIQLDLIDPNILISLVNSFKYINDTFTYDKLLLKLKADYGLQKATSGLSFLGSDLKGKDQQIELQYIQKKLTPEIYFVRERIEELFTKDQNFRGLVHLGKCDTSNLYKEWDRLDFLNIESLYYLCKKLKKFPNNFEFGLTAAKLQLIISHNLRSRSNIIRTWNLIGIFIEEAYLNGKISDDYFKVYDECLYKSFGYQYYGTLSDIRAEVTPEILARKLKFKL